MNVTLGLFSFVAMMSFFLVKQLKKLTEASKEIAAELKKLNEGKK